MKISQRVQCTHTKPLNEPWERVCECEGEHVPAKHLRAELPIQGQGHFRHSALWVSVTCLIACQGAHLSQFASGKNKPENWVNLFVLQQPNGPTTTTSTAATLHFGVWPKRRRQLFKFGRVQKLCSLFALGHLPGIDRHLEQVESCRESTPLASNGDVAEDDTGGMELASL